MTEDKWKKTVKERDGNMCRRCGFDKNLHVHHILPKEKYSALEREPSNGTTLCSNCHALLKDKEESTDLRGFLPNDTKIDKQLKSIYVITLKRKVGISEKIKKYLRGDNVVNSQAAKYAYEIAQGRMKQKRYKEAIADFDEAIRHKSDYFQAYLNRGHAKLKLEYYTAAIYDYNKAVYINPNNVDVYMCRGFAKRCIKNYSGAIADYDMYIKLSSDPASGYRLRGVVKHEMGEHEAAIVDYDKSIYHKDDEADVYLLRGRAKLKLEQYEAAVEDFRYAIYDCGLEDTESYKLLADAYCGTGYWEAALGCLDSAIELKNDDPSLYKYRAELNEVLGQYEDAIDDYDQAIQLKPNDADTILARGLVKYYHYFHHYLGREDEAFTDFDTAFSIKPDLRSEDCLDKSILSAYIHWKNN